jgi:hypothetical protein
VHWSCRTVALGSSTLLDACACRRDKPFLRYHGEADIVQLKSRCMSWRKIYTTRVMLYWCDFVLWLLADCTRWKRYTLVLQFWDNWQPNVYIHHFKEWRSLYVLPLRQQFRDNAWSMYTPIQRMKTSVWDSEVSRCIVCTFFRSCVDLLHAPFLRWHHWEVGKLKVQMLHRCLCFR